MTMGLKQLHQLFQFDNINHSNTKYSDYTGRELWKNIFVTFAVIFTIRQQAILTAVSSLEHLSKNYQKIGSVLSAGLAKKISLFIKKWLRCAEAESNSHPGFSYAQR